MSGRQQRQIDDLLTNSALSDAQADERIDELLREAEPSVKQADPSGSTYSESSYFDASDDDVRRVKFRPAVEDSSSSDDEDIVLLPQPINAAEPEAIESSQPLWREAQPELNAFDNVGVEPVMNDINHTQPDSVQSTVNKPLVDKPSTRHTHKAVSRASKLWARASTRARIAVIVAALTTLVASIMCVALIGEKPAQVDAPASAPVVDSPAAVAPADEVLQPGCSQTDQSCRAVEQQGCTNSASDPMLAFDTHQVNGRYSQAWICGRRWANVDGGVTLTIRFPRVVVITSITVIPGFGFVEPSGQDHWVEHRLVSLISWRLGGNEYMQPIAPSVGGATRTLPNVATQLMSATIQATVRPPHAPNSGVLGLSPDDRKVDGAFAIGHVTITGHAAG